MAEDAGEDGISPFDAAHYTYQMTDELRRMARDGGLGDLADALDQARIAALQAMRTLGAQPEGNPTPDNAA